MTDRKRTRVENAGSAEAERRQLAIVSLAHCLARCDIYRLHHDVLIQEVLAAGGVEHFTTAKKVRFAAYVFSWFAGLATVIERYQQLVSSGTIPQSEELGALLTSEYLDLLKPFRNAVAHCSDHDDGRVLALLDTPQTTPDVAAAMSEAFKRYFRLHSSRSLYSDEGDLVDES